MVKHGHEASKRDVLRRNGVGLAEGELLFPGQHFSQYHLRDLLYRSQWWPCSGSELSLVDAECWIAACCRRIAGCFVYGSGTLYPTDTWLSTNYWLDVVFSPASGPTPGQDSGQTTDPIPSTYNISGNVRGSAATLTLSGAASRSTSTDASGNYSFTGLPNGSYIIAPSQTGYTFSPTTTSVTINGASATGVNFTGTPVATSIQHSVVLSWSPSTSTNLKGYNVYRADTAGGAFTKMTASPIGATAYTDSTVASGRTYYYVSTAVDNNNVESGYSNQATAVVPTP